MGSLHRYPRRFVCFILANHFKETMAKHDWRMTGHGCEGGLESQRSLHLEPLLGPQVVVCLQNPSRLRVTAGGA